MSTGDCIEVVFHFKGPVARPAHPIHLDAVLLYANAPTPDLEDAARKLLDEAVQSVGEGQHRVYCCSAIAFNEVETFTRFNTRRLDLSTYAEDIASGLVSAKASSVVDTSRGDIKGMLADIPMMWVSEAKAYVRVKNTAAFDQLMRGVRQIGKFGRLGYGRVFAPEYNTADPVADDAWMRRVLPFAVEGAAPIRATVSPPYWDRRRVIDAFVHPSLLV